MIYLVDSNVLLHFAWRQRSEHQVVRAAVRKLRPNGQQLLTTTQNYIECWQVATRPTANNGLGLNTVAARRLLGLIERLFPRLPDTDLIYPLWRDLVVSFAVAGRQVYDARLVAVMRAASITHILTFNTRDFTRYASLGIVAVNPATV